MGHGGPTSWDMMVLTLGCGGPKGWDMTALKVGLWRPYKLGYGGSKGWDVAALTLGCGGPKLSSWLCWPRIGVVAAPQVWVGGVGGLGVPTLPWAPPGVSPPAFVIRVIKAFWCRCAVLCCAVSHPGGSFFFGGGGGGTAANQPPKASPTAALPPILYQTDPSVNQPTD